MSRGFVKEDDLEHAGLDVPERPLSLHPNYVTANGYAQLEQQAKTLDQQRLLLSQQKDDAMAIAQLAIINRDLRYVAARLASALQIKSALQTNTHAASEASHKSSIEHVVFGTTVTVEDEDGNNYTYQIVGEDEADIKINKISWVSPLAAALIGQKVGDQVIWPRPAGNKILEIIEINC